LLFNKYLGHALNSRFRGVQEFAWRFLSPPSSGFTPSESAVRILTGGDVTFDLDQRTMPTFGANIVKEGVGKNKIINAVRWVWGGVLKRTVYSQRHYNPLIDYYEFRTPKLKKPDNLQPGHMPVSLQSAQENKAERAVDRLNTCYPFEKIGPFMNSKDMVMVNLETPLARKRRCKGFFISDPQYAAAMKDAGISMVSLANNHIFDAGEGGLLDTMKHLDNAGISYTGAGMNLEDARSGKLIKVRGLKFIYLSYTQFCIHKYFSIASSEYPGVLPMDTELMIDDIKKAGENADFVFVCLHWGYENQPSVHMKQVEIAHLLIDAGADAIIGHHPHVPHGIEIYKRRPILYSLGNFIFGWSVINWTNDNILAEIVIDNREIQGVVIYPVSGRKKELFQPELLSGKRADSLLHELQIKSKEFNTGIAIKDHVGYIKI